MTIGHCKHGEFELEKGCKECIAERRAIGIRPEQDEMEDGLNDEGLTLAKSNIVKVRYYSETTEELSPREYTYYSADKLNVGSTVIVPVRDTTGKAKVSAIDVSESEIAAFKDRVKTIPTGSIVTETYVMPDEMRGVKISPNAARLVDDIAEKLQEPEPIDYSHPAFSPDPNAWRTGEEEVRLEPEQRALVRVDPLADLEVGALVIEAEKILSYAKARKVTTLEQAKSANDDLTIIGGIRKRMEACKKQYLEPVNAIKDRLIQEFKEILEPIYEADKITRDQLLAYDKEQKRLQAEAEETNRLAQEVARRQAEANNGEFTVDTTPVAVIEAPKRFATDTGTSSIMKIRKWEVIDFTQVPDELKLIDAGKVTKLVKAGIGAIAGIRIWSEDTIRNTAR